MLQNKQSSVSQISDGFPQSPHTLKPARAAGMKIVHRATILGSFSPTTAHAKDVFTKVALFYFATGGSVAKGTTGWAPAEVIFTVEAGK